MPRVDADLSGDKTQDLFEPVPPGEYILMVVDSDVRRSRSGSYLMAVFEFEVLTPREFARRKVWDQIIIRGLDAGANEDALRIGREKLKTLATMSGHNNPNFIGDTEELHGLTVAVRLTVDGEYNRIKGYKRPKNTSHTTTPAQAAPAAQTPEAAAPPVPPPTQQPQPTRPQYPWES